MLLPKSNVDFVSDSLKLAGEQQIIMVVRALPPRDSCKILVSLESRYGMWVLLPSASAEITLPRAESDLLMFFASSKTVPSAPVFDTWKITKRENVLNRSLSAEGFAFTNNLIFLLLIVPSRNQPNRPDTIYRRVSSDSLNFPVWRLSGIPNGNGNCARSCL